MIEGSTVSLSFMEGKYTFNMAVAPLPEQKEKGCFVAGTNVVIFSEATRGAEGRRVEVHQVVHESRDQRAVGRADRLRAREDERDGLRRDDIAIRRDRGA